MNGIEELLRQAGDGLSLLERPDVHAAGVWLLAIVFAVSGAAKLRRPLPAALAMSDFGLVPSPERRYGIAAGTVEAALAVALAAAAVAHATAVPLVAFAAALLWLFTALLASAVRADRAMACACFGNGDQVGRSTVLRTAALAIFATLLTVAGADAAASESVATVVRELCLAAALAGAALLLARTPRLVRWNRDPFATGARVRRLSK